MKRTKLFLFCVFGLDRAPTVSVKFCQTNKLFVAETFRLCNSCMRNA